jgi:outer membrane lipoprotein-sorting protein
VSERSSARQTRLDAALCICALLAPLALLAGGGAPLPAQAAIRDPEAARAEDVARIEAYLNSLHSLRAKFVQVNPDGANVTGTLSYERPDKMRLDYDPPSKLLIIANGWDLVYQDRKLKQVSHLFTSKTPLGFLLTKHIRLSGDVTVTNLEHRGGELRVTLVQTDEPTQGSITLAFAEQPFELRRWTVIDPQGYATNVILDRIETDVPLDGELFVYRNPDFNPDMRR